MRKNIMFWLVEPAHSFLVLVRSVMVIIAITIFSVLNTISITTSISVVVMIVIGIDLISVFLGNNTISMYPSKNKNAILLRVSDGKLTETSRTFLWKRNKKIPGNVCKLVFDYDKEDKGFFCWNSIRITGRYKRRIDISFDLSVHIPMEYLEHTLENSFYKIDFTKLSQVLLEEKICFSSLIKIHAENFFQAILKLKGEAFKENFYSERYLWRQNLPDFGNMLADMNIPLIVVRVTSVTLSTKVSF